jgi:hypothetical protein
LCSTSQSYDICTKLGNLASKYNKSAEEKKQNELLLKEQREKLITLQISSQYQKSAESYVDSIARPRAVAPMHLRRREMLNELKKAKNEMDVDPNEEKFQDPNSSTSLNLLPDLMGFFIFFFFCFF